MIVWLILGVQFFCSVVISVSYFMINIKSRQSSRNSGQNSNREAVRRNRAMQNRIALVIATNFACWVPFIIISGLHNLETIDATDWYVTFALIDLPLNSVINPILYDSTLKELFDEAIRHFTARCSRGATYLRLIVGSAEQTQVTVIEMVDQIERASQVRADEDVVMETPF